jgi:uncharacterized OsmC-like protein
MRRAVGLPRHQLHLSSRSAHTKSYAVTGIGKGTFSAVTTANGFEIRSDVPRLSGGGDLAPEPVYLLLSALVGCKQATAEFVSLKMRMPRIERIAFDLRAVRDQRGAIGLPIDRDPEIPAR